MDRNWPQRTATDEDWGTAMVADWGTGNSNEAEKVLLY